jgi:hypothetical protein
MANSMANTTALTTHTHAWQFIPTTPSITTTATAITSATPSPFNITEDGGVAAAVPAIIIAGGSGSQAAAGPRNPFLQLYRDISGQGLKSIGRQRKRQRNNSPSSLNQPRTQTDQHQFQKRDPSTGAWVGWAGMVLGGLLGLGLVLFLLDAMWEALMPR